jgi:hypothetical protein
MDAFCDVSNATFLMLWTAPPPAPGKDRFGKSKHGDRYLRSLFTTGALAVIRYAKIHGTKHRPKNSGASRICIALMPEPLTLTRGQAGQLSSTGVHEPPLDCSAISSEATGATSAQRPEARWGSCDHPRFRSFLLQTVLHASQTTLVQARAYSSAQADIDLIGSPSVSPRLLDIR